MDESPECEKQVQTSDMEALNNDGTCTNTPMPETEGKINSDYPDLLQKEHDKLLKTTCITSTHIQPAEPSVATADLNLKEQSEFLKLDQMTLGQEGLPDCNSTEDDLTVKHMHFKDSNAPQRQCTELAQKSDEQLENLQEQVQSPASLKPAGLFFFCFFLLKIINVLLHTDNPFMVRRGKRTP